MVLDTLVRLEMPFDVMCNTLVVYKSKCVGAETVHMTIGVWSASVGKYNHNLMKGLGSKGQEVPERISVLQIGLRVALLRVVKIGEFEGVAAI